MFLIYFTIRRIIEQLESNEFDHTFCSEELNVVWVLGLLLSQGEDSSAKSGIKSVVEEFTHRHLIDLNRRNLVLVIRIRLWIHKLLQILEHLTRIAAIHNLVIHLLRFLLLRLLLCVEMDFVLELLINFFFLFVEREFDLLELCMIA